MADGTVLYSEAEGRLFIRMIGQIRHTISSGLQALIRRRVLQEGGVQDVLLDLSEAQYLDSTNLGLLAQIARHMIRQFNRRPTLLCANPEILVLLDTMGFDEVFTIVRSTEVNPPELQEVGRVPQDAREKARMMLDAHRTLVAMNAHNAATFRNVVEIFEKELADD